MGVPRPFGTANLCASLAVVGFLAAVGYGLPAVDRSVSGLRPVRAGVPYPVGAGVKVVPPAGAQVDVGVTRPGRDTGTATFVLGDVRMLILVRPYAGSVLEATTELRDKIRRTDGVRLTADGRYAGVGIEGRYAVQLCAGVAVELTVRGPAAGMARLAGPVDASLASVTCREPP